MMIKASQSSRTEANNSMVKKNKGIFINKGTFQNYKRLVDMASPDAISK